jgi:phosphoribulokinase
MEETGKTYWQFQEHALNYGKSIRTLRTGEAFVQLFNDPNLHRVQIRFDHFFDLPRTDEKIAEFKQQNFESDYFISPAVASQKFQLLRNELLTERIVVSSKSEINSGGKRLLIDSDEDNGFG